MKLSKELIKKGIYLSGIMNIGGVLVFSRFFTNKVINEADPVTMSNFGLLMIVVWGLVFLAIVPKWEHLKWVIGVFAIEKIIYALTWSKWLMNNDLSSVYKKDTMAGIFYTIYGLNDWLFCIFYLLVFIYLSKLEKNK
ncbi:hypothetical protein [Flavobacterium caseinilyticum]|uniref:Uncharacterized protein n=1 Tax=Flavobacterium caseinilyticum TaxID=2541732 RepID=A0A4R5ARQ5_9FLAO|nr:hypothetical protein [Flavobacterium caseinilyticum]TDD73784.1 hypothetical protein E0F89_16745 [Flavobacterium caseinilyticum]